VNRTSVHNLQQSRPLGLVEIALQYNGAFDAVNLALVYLTVFAISRIDFAMPQGHLDRLQRKLLMFRIHINRDRCAGPEPGEQYIIRR
jgi:hypothetical protein